MRLNGIYYNRIRYVKSSFFHQDVGKPLGVQCSFKLNLLMLFIYLHLKSAILSLFRHNKNGLFLKKKLI